jgi:MFS family permease
MFSSAESECKSSEAKKAIPGPSAIECQEDEKYSVFTNTEKWCIVAIISSAAFSSNIGSFIYYPALKLLSETFSVSISQINLTITAYMAVATVAPTLSGDAADVLGRRPTYLVTLSLFVTANICLALAKSYNGLLGLRVLQALGVSGKVLQHSLNYFPSWFTVLAADIYQQA